MKDIFMLITFESTHRAIHIERKLKGKIEIDMIPTPREISASCGLSIKFSEQDLDTVKSILEAEVKEGIQLYRFNKIKEPKAILETWEVQSAT